MGRRAYAGAAAAARLEAAILLEIRNYLKWL
jgi:hypothetical protein